MSETKKIDFAKILVSVVTMAASFALGMAMYDQGKKLMSKS
jgi:hypothetical protein